MPLSDLELLDLLKDLESDRVERKSSASGSDKIREAICAFANDLPNHRKVGVVFVGVHDDGRSASLLIDDRLLLTLSNLRDDGNIQPIPSMTVARHTLGECTVAVIEVSPATAPPVRYQGRTWIRVGPRRAIASAQEEAQLSERRRSRDIPFDARGLSGSTLADLDLPLFEQDYLPNAVARDVLRQNGRTIAQKLISLRFTDPEGVPTPVGLLVAGVDPVSFVPGAYIQFIRFDGSELTDRILNSKKITGTLQEQLQAVDALLAIQITTSTEIVAGTEQLHSDYPRIALQELIRNALMHRDYEVSRAPVRVLWFTDRIEIHNPGGPYGQVTRERFGAHAVTDYRNPHLAEAMRVLGYAQRFGVGIATARKELQKNGNPALEFDVQESSVMAVIRGHR